MKLTPAPNGYLCEDDPGEIGLGGKRWSVNDMEARIVSELFKGDIVLEIGTGLGVSTKAIAEKAKYVWTVDVDKWVEENVAPSLPENVKFCNSIVDVPELLDGAFIDSLHTYSQCCVDIIEARKRVKKGGLIVFHDANMEQIRKAIVDSKLECYEIKTVAGIAFGWND
jgi:tRNA A58 N-methylase Trm61